MKKTVTLLAAVSIVGGASATAVSCSFKGDKNKGGTTDQKTTDKESSQVLLKMEVQNYLNEKGAFDSKESAIKDIQSKSDWKTEGIDSLTGSVYGTDSVSSIHIKGKLKKGYIWPKTSAGEFDVIIKINNEKNVSEVAKELSMTFYNNEDEAKENIRTKFKSITGVDQVSVVKILTVRSQLKFEISLNYRNNVEGPEKIEVLINLKNNLTTDIYAANQSISKDNKKYESKIAAAKFIKSTFESIEGVEKTSLVWDQWAPYNYTISIKYDEKSKGPENAEGVIQLKTNLTEAIKTAKNIFESKEYKSSVSAKNAVESNLKIEGILNAEFSWEDEVALKYNIKLSYSNDFFGPSSISGTLLKYESASFDKIENQTIDMRKTNKILIDVKGKNLTNKKISVSSDDSSIQATYADGKITLVANDNKNIRAVIKVWDEEEKEDAIEFTTIILAKPEIVSKLEPEYGWYLNHETSLDIMMKDFDKAKGDNLEFISQLQEIENSFPVSTYAEIKLVQDSENQQKFTLYYKFIKSLPENGKVKIALKLNGEMGPIFTLVSKQETDISENIDKELNNIKNNYNWKQGQENNLQKQVESDLKSISGISDVYFEWIDKGELSYKVTINYKLGNTGEKVFSNNGTWYMPAEFEEKDSLTFDMRNPTLNTYEVYGKNLSGKTFKIESDNPEVIAETDGKVNVKNNRQFLTIKVSSTAKDDVTSLINLYQEDDPNQKIEITANVWALPYVTTIGENWTLNNSNRLEIKENEEKNLLFTVNNFKSKIDDVYLTQDPASNLYEIETPKLLDEKTGKFQITVKGKKANAGWFPVYEKFSIWINGKNELMTTTQVKK
ncbi:unknown lipoprotein [Mesoplasma florum L1]|uniref:Lipoprotein-associated type-17 domain-containing protein n=1 Tax=Mesoplasma florum (strain ATCC 33453 / NBRC 100688 / NCTC 11704 / L1) TaxID=265311 RepID=Q6F0W0_MESFL|nr:hypothetical protein [Mesoplasma florum]AAT75863.1 unknown lipoprotein [Mesoplasma florum L1]